MSDISIDNKFLKAIEKELNKLTGGKFHFTAEVDEEGIVIYADEDYYSFNDEGVSGTERKYNTRFSYTDKMPPASSFSKYSSDRSTQFAIAKSIQKKGIKPKHYSEKIEDSKKLQELVEAAYENVVDELIYEQLKDL